MMEIVPNKFYKMLCPRKNIEGIINVGLYNEPYLNWDCVRLRADGTKGFSIKFIEHDMPGRYKIETDAANWGDYRFFSAGKESIYLDKHSDAHIWEVTPLEDDLISIRLSGTNYHIGVGGIINPKEWLIAAPGLNNWCDKWRLESIN